MGSDGSWKIIIGHIPVESYREISYVRNRISIFFEEKITEPIRVTTDSQDLEAAHTNKVHDLYRDRAA